jgi:RNA polymerase sigma-70 factor (ECF subfamily)
VTVGLSELKESRRAFLALVEDVRPDLHRYCARMTGSVADGEDVVQQTLARAYYGLAELDALPALKPWLFRIAHACCIDHLRGYAHRMGERLDDARRDAMPDDALDPEGQLARDEAVGAALSRFAALPPSQRGAVILKDVLGHSLEEIAALLELTVPAVKAALHRGRETLKNSAEPRRARGAPSAVLARYVALFNGRDFDGVRAMLADDVKLDVVSRSKRSGRSEVGFYFSNYEGATGWQLKAAWLDGREVLAAFWDGAARPKYFIELEVRGSQVAAIRDFLHVPYITRDAALEVP